MYQSLTGDQLVQEELLWKDCPADRMGDFDYLVEVLDWEANVDPAFVANHFMRPKLARPAGKPRATWKSGSAIDPKPTVQRNSPCCPARP